MEAQKIIKPGQKFVELRNPTRSTLVFQIYNQYYAYHSFSTTQGEVGPMQTLRIELQENKIADGVGVMEQQRLVFCKKIEGKSIQRAMIENSAHLEEIIFEAEPVEQDPMLKSDVSEMLRNSRLVENTSADRLAVVEQTESNRIDGFASRPRRAAVKTCVFIAAALGLAALAWIAYKFA